MAEKNQDAAMVQLKSKPPVDLKLYNYWRKVSDSKMQENVDFFFVVSVSLYFNQVTSEGFFVVLFFGLYSLLLFFY